MNQAIQFPDREAWNEEDSMIYFPVLIGGFQRECRISAAQIQVRFGGSDADTWLALFREHRWDIEDLFEDLVLNEQDDSFGYYSLS
ncbi:MAG: DUF1488 domain-containing protein [Symbiopectobacterium sp.]|uniref:DUF1488 domain-containing protein n=1 Tax=Symbiopectobacterium sp. TaxID=2952789 RepID=UPI0039E9BA1D